VDDLERILRGNSFRGSGRNSNNAFFNDNNPYVPGAASQFQRERMAAYNTNNVRPPLKRRIIDEFQLPDDNDSNNSGSIPNIARSSSNSNKRAPPTTTTTTNSNTNRTSGSSSSILRNAGERFLDSSTASTTGATAQRKNDRNPSSTRSSISDTGHYQSLSASPYQTFSSLKPPDQKNHNSSNLSSVDRLKLAKQKELSQKPDSELSSLERLQKKSFNSQNRNTSSRNTGPTTSSSLPPYPSTSTGGNPVPTTEDDFEEATRRAIEESLQDVKETRTKPSSSSSSSSFPPRPTSESSRPARVNNQTTSSSSVMPRRNGGESEDAKEKIRKLQEKLDEDAARELQEREDAIYQEYEKEKLLKEQQRTQAQEPLPVDTDYSMERGDRIEGRLNELDFLRDRLFNEETYPQPARNNNSYGTAHSRSNSLENPFDLTRGFDEAYAQEIGRRNTSAGSGSQRRREEERKPSSSGNNNNNNNNNSYYDEEDELLARALQNSLEDT
jgi:hypothetical protein